MNKKYLKYHLLAAFIFLIIALVAVRKFLNLDVYIGHNWDSPYSALKDSYSAVLRGLLYIWNDNYSLGVSILPSFSNRPWWLFNAICGILFQGKFVAQFQIILAMLFGGFFMYYYLFTVFLSAGYKSRAVFPAFCGGLFFSLSPVFLGHFIGGAFNQMDTLVLLPLLLTILHIGICAKNLNRIVICISVLMALIATSLQNFIFGGLFVFLYVLFFYPIAWKNKLIVYVKIFLLTLALSLFWILPLVYSVIGENVQQRLQENLSYSNLIYNVPAVSDALFTNGYVRQFYNFLVWPGIYGIWKTVALLVVSFVALATLFLRKKYNQLYKYGLFWWVLYLFFLIFASGFLSPFGAVVEYLYKNFSLMAVFRSPQWWMMPLTVTFAILIGFAVEILLDKLKNINKYTVYGVRIFIILIILFMLHPTFLYGDLGADRLYQRAKLGESWYKADHLDGYKMPDDYREAISYLSQLPDNGRVILLPLSGSPYYMETDYQREGAGVDPVIIYKSPKPFIFNDLYDDYNGKALISMMEKEAYVSKNIDFLYFGKIFNARYLLLKKDYSPVSSAYRKYWNGEEMYGILRDNMNQIGEIIIDGKSTVLIKLNDKYFLPHIYSPAIADFYNIDIDQKISNDGTISIEGNNIVRLMETLKRTESTAVIPPQYGDLFANARKVNKLKINYDKINPIKYRIKISGAQESFPLIFSEAFNGNWKIYPVRGAGRSFYETYFQKPLSEKNHFIANGYGNGWLIDLDGIKDFGKYELNKDNTIDFELIIEFWPQRLFYVGMALSGMALLGCIIYLVSAFFMGRSREIEREN